MVLENFSWGSWKVLEKSWIFFVSKRVGTLVKGEGQGCTVLGGCRITWCHEADVFLAVIAAVFARNSSNVANSQDTITADGLQGLETLADTGNSLNVLVY